MGDVFKSCEVDTGLVALLIDGKVIPPIAYTSYLPQEKYYRQISEQGLHLYCFPAYLARRGINSGSKIGPFRRGIWEHDGALDFTDIEEDMRKITSADPDACVIMRVHLDVPEWWERKYPQECSITKDGITLRQSFASDKWLEDASRVLREIIGWFAQSRYAHHLVGVHVAAGQTEEWIYHARGIEDESPSRLRKFNAYLRDRYGSDEAIQVAWAESYIKDPAAALDALAMAPEKRWRDSRRDAAALDAFRFHSKLMADAIAVFCRVVKECGNGRLLTGAFYGYCFYIMDSRFGHAALSQLLECRDLDYIASPNSYTEGRMPGVDWMPMSAVDSVRLHSKIWMTENDTRTSLTVPLGKVAPELVLGDEKKYYDSKLWYGPADVQTSAALMRANSGRMLAHGYGGWWFDMWGGWFSHPAYLGEIRALQNEWLNVSQIDDPARIPKDCMCIIMDEDTANKDAAFGGLCGVFRNSQVISRCGRPFRIYLREDMPALDLSQARFVWLLGVLDITEAEKKLISRLMGRDVVVLLSDDEGTRRFGGSTMAGAADMICVRQLRTALDEAGMHSFIESEDVFHIGRGYVSIHAATEGVKCLKIPGSPLLQQVLPPTQEMVDGNGFFMTKHETRVLRIKPRVNL